MCISVSDCRWDILLSGDVQLDDAVNGMGLEEERNESETLSDVICKGNLIKSMVHNQLVPFLICQELPR